MTELVAPAFTGRDLQDRPMVRQAHGGAHAFVFKRRMASDLLQAINDAIDGRLFLSESVNAVYLQTAQKVSARENASPLLRITGTENGG